MFSVFFSAGFSAGFTIDRDFLFDLAEQDAGVVSDGRCQLGLVAGNLQVLWYLPRVPASASRPAKGILAG